MKNKKIRRILIIVIVFIMIVSSTILVANLVKEDFDFDQNLDSESEEFGQKSTEDIEEFSEISEEELTEGKTEFEQNQPEKEETLVKTQAPKSDNCTATFNELMLINPNFTVSTDFISERKSQLVNITDIYGIKEGNPGNGVPLLDPEAAKYLNNMLSDYKKAYPGHEITTRSCFRSEGTTCGRLCYATGTSDHHSGYTCDLIDDAYGGILDTDYLESHPEWTWLHQNSYKYGFIDRFVSEWAGGSMSAPANVDETGTTGLYETWHFRYVGKNAAKEIALGKYNDGNYDSLEHYLKASGKITNLLDKTSCN